MWRWNQRFLSGSVMVVFLMHHLKSLRCRRQGPLYESTQDDVVLHWYLYEAGLIALAAHVRTPWIPLGLALVPLSEMLQTVLYRPKDTSIKP